MPKSVKPQVSQRDSYSSSGVIQRFFSSEAGAAFARDCRELLEACTEEGTGDPLRWSEARLRQLLARVIVDDDYIPVQAQLRAPELLHAFVPFAHAESGIRQELTAEALTAIHEAADDHRAVVLEEAREQGYYDDEDDEVDEDPA
jgi:hypothetical protein